jgi:catechol 2,3-dioxygenase-like lactoylglutathione lyase family enzyme
MRAIRLNHVSIRAADLAESVQFYCDLFGMEKIPTPYFGAPLQWLRLGDLQLHLFQRDTPTPQFEHIALEVDDFEAVYRKAQELGIFDRRRHGHHLFELPSGCVQLYLSDPAGNLLEIVWPDVTTLDRTVIADLVRRTDRFPQSDEGQRATLFLTPRAPAPVP